MGNQIAYAVAAFQDSNTTYREDVLAELKRLQGKIPDLKYAFED